ncbi:MAG: hypothetical protein LBJ80_04150 [Rickettsiales bacterium]|jgi:hypothetical protein|nr:hypothetical protein [Rickettsiales bacterium]MDR1261581.1 hypothetical protein [Rickettsiales bacterium]
MSKSEKVKKYFLRKSEPVSEKRKEDLMGKFRYAAGEFGKAGTRSDYQAVPKEEQASIDLGNKKIFGVKNKILRWVEHKFKHLFPRYDYSSEIGTKDRKIPGGDSKVKYFTLDEQIDQTRFIGEENGERKLYNLTGELYDTTGETSKGEEDCVAYVITLDGKLVTHKHININEGELAYRHSTLAGGKPILCSGLMKVVDGKITYIDNNSGHYKPTSANLYKAVKKLEGLFSENAKIVYRPHWINFIKQIPFIRKIVPTKQESIEKFVKRMEKEGKDELPKYERDFERVKKYNEKYSDKLESQSVYARIAASNYKPVSILDSDSRAVKKMATEHSIRKIIGANYGHKPKIDIQYNEKKAVGINVIFRYKDDCDEFIKLLDLKKHSYICTPHQDEKEVDVLLKYINDEKDIAAIKKSMPSKRTVFMSKDQANKFIKNTLEIKIGSVEQLGNTAAVKTA